MAGSDFVFVQLTSQGQALAAGKPLRVSGRTSIQFTPGQPVRVALYEWNLMLKNFETTAGVPLFELVTAQAPAAPTPAPPAAATAAPAPTAPVAAQAPAADAAKQPSVPTQTKTQEAT
jgi:hypothetical protein